MLRYDCGYNSPTMDMTRAIQGNIQNTKRYTALAPQRFTEFFQD
jgi:hypothetical protein